jgi:hypothetical protein
MLTLTTPELREGDIVITHGMRCLIDRPLTLSRDGKTFYVWALVLNRDEVPDAIVPLHWTRDIATGEHRWTIQGNDLARWYVEREQADALGRVLGRVRASYRRDRPSWTSDGYTV